jgi:hypothetical protein
MDQSPFSSPHTVKLMPVTSSQWTPRPILIETDCTSIEPEDEVLLGRAYSCHGQLWCTKHVLPRTAEGVACVLSGSESEEVTPKQLVVCQ